MPCAKNNADRHKIFLFNNYYSLIPYNVDIEYFFSENKKCGVLPCVFICEQKINIKEN